MTAPGVTMINGKDLRDQDAEIRRGADGAFYLHLILTGEKEAGSGSVIVAKCQSSDRLGRWALDAGVRNVRHEYDLTSRALMTPGV